MVLAKPQVWHRVALEDGAGSSCAGADGGGGHAASLRFKLDPPAEGGGVAVAGFLFSSRFLFHDPGDTLDTRTMPTHWSTIFVPFGFGGGARRAAAVELRTESISFAKFDLTAGLTTAAGEAAPLIRSAASVATGLRASEFFT